MKKAFLATALLCLAPALAAGATPADGENPREIIRAMERNMRGDSSRQVMNMKTVRPRFTREITFRSWSLGDDYSLVVVTAPARDEGTAFLKRGREIWNYQPSIERTVRMPPSMMSQSWMGSDFTNDDLVRSGSLVDDYRHSHAGTATIDEWECDIIDLAPEPENPVVYERTRYWVTRDHRLPARAENYDERDELVNTIHFREIRRLGGRLLPTVMEMVPAREEGRRTIIQILEADFGVDLSEDFFSLRNLGSGRRR